MTNANHITTHASRRTAARRGVAMLLVLIALGVGVVLAGVAITSRQPAPRIGENACQDAAARWGAHAAACFAEAVLETAADSVTYSKDNAGAFIQSFPVENGTATVRLTRLDGSAPQDGDRELLMTATATVGSMTATVQKRVSIAIPVPIDTAADARLGEFALFAGNSLTIGKGAIIAHSPKALECGTLTPVKVGVGFSNISSLDIDEQADLRHAAMFVDADASTSLEDMIKDECFYSGKRIPYSIPMIREATCAEVLALPILSAILSLLDGVTQSLAGGNYAALTVQNNSVITLGSPGTTTVYKFSSMTVQTSGVLRFEGNVIVQVSGATNIRSKGAIEPASADSTMKMYLGRNVTIDDCALGLPREVARDATRTYESAGAHTRADHLYLSTLTTASGGSASPNWHINNAALVLGAINAPDATITINGSSTIIGRVTAGALSIADACAIYYDPRLDCRAGITELDGPLYIEQLPIPEVTTLFSAASASAGIQTLQTNLKTTLETVWAAEPRPNVLVKPNSFVLPIDPDILTGGDDDGLAPTSIVSIDGSGTANTRVRGRARFAVQHGRVEGFED